MTIILTQLIPQYLVAHLEHLLYLASLVFRGNVAYVRLIDLDGQKAKIRR